MDAIKQDRLISGQGTTEYQWQKRLAENPVIAIDVQTLVRNSKRIVLLAPHPDDEVLPCGGILAKLTELHIPILIIAITDGEASHPGSKYWTTSKLKEQRPLESKEALNILAINAQVIRLEIPDGQVSACKKQIIEQLQKLIQDNDCVIAPWILDGHPDHEAVATIAKQIKLQKNINLIEVPIWMWHWASPDEKRIPWGRARFVNLENTIRNNKTKALQAFTSQILYDPDASTTPILPDYVLQRFTRTFEVVFV